jgi:putative cell wall-binding protein
MEFPLHHAVRALTLAVLAGLLAVAPVLAAATATGPGTIATAPRVAAAELSAAKVVIIVGATHGDTSRYRDIADSAYAEAIKWSSNVVKVYSPNATWAAVKAAAAGASVVVYLGHGNGWPSPYSYDPNFTTKDGFGLNTTAGNGDYNNTYYGEPHIATLGLAPNAVVLLNHLCYASGNSEDSSDPGFSVASQRVDNYGAAFLKAGARAVIAEAHGSVNGMIRALFTTDQTILEAWRGQYSYNGNEMSFASGRSPGYTAVMDLESPSGGYFRSLVGNPDLRTRDVITAPAAPVAQTEAPVFRQSGVDRYATAAAISAATFAPGVAVAYVATGLNFPDALAGAAAAGHLGAPILLVAPDSVPAATATELQRLQPGRVVILGGPGAVSDGVAGTLSYYTSGGVFRQSGVDRYATAAAISAATFAPGVPVAYVATGLNFPDALAGAAAAGHLGAPILLVAPDSVPAATATELLRLQPGRVVILGGPGAVSDGVAGTLSYYTTGGVFRLSGSDRYSTAAAISAATFAPGVPVAYVATGLNFPDALAGAAAAGYLGAPILLVTPDSVPAATVAELARLNPGRVVILGGPGAVSDAIVGILGAAAGS